MTVRDKTTLKSYFETDDYPTEPEYADLIDTALPLFRVQDYGAIGDGITDDTIAIQAAINAALAAENGTVWFPPTNGNGDTTKGYLVTASLIIEPAAGDVRNLAFVSLVSDDTRGIVWGGGNNTSVIITRGWKVSRVERLNIQIPASKSGVVAWDITDPAASPSSGHITFSNCSVQLLGTNCIGWRGGGLNSSGSDISFLNFNNCLVSGHSDAAASGHIGWYIAHSNCLNWVWNGGFGWGMDILVKAADTLDAGGIYGGGSMFFYGLGASHNQLEFRLGGQGAWTIVGGRFEVGKRFLECGQYAGGNSYPMNISVIGAEIGYYTPTDGIFALMGTPGSLLFENCFIWSSGLGFTWDANMFTLGGWNLGYGSLTIRGGSIQTATEPIYTVGHGNWTIRIENVGSMDVTGNINDQLTEVPEIISESTYTRKVLSTSPVHSLPSWESQGVVAHDLTGRGNHAGYLAGATLGQTGIGDGKLCPSFDGINYGINGFSAGLAALLGGEGSLMVWMKFYTSFWTDNLVHTMMSLYSADYAGVYVGFYKLDNNSLIAGFRTNNVWKDTAIVTTATTWINLILTWSNANDQFGIFLNGVQQGAYATGLGAWTGPIVGYDIGQMTNGSAYQMAHVNLWNKPLVQAQITDLASLY